MPEEPENSEQVPLEDGSGTPLFRASATTLFRVALVTVVLGVVSAGYAAYAYYHSPWWNRVSLALSQPVLFSHRHHTAELKIDCRYCHATVETSSFAGMPSTHTCLSCHSQIFHDTPMLQAVVMSAETGHPLRWNRVNSLPDHVYFNHSIHVAKGVGCTTCHGQVGQSALMAKGESLEMRWCVDCHRDPASRLRPREEIFSPSWLPRPGAEPQGKGLMATYHVETEHLLNCSTCHH